MELLYLGLMSGTSLDGIDAALVSIDESSEPLGATLRPFLTYPYESSQREAIKAAINSGTAEELARLNRDLGVWFADAASQLLAHAGLQHDDLAAVGSHGQTVWHQPPTSGVLGATFQIGDGAVIAERLGVDVISDFRARDVAAGGHGAPLVPLIDQLLFSHPDHPRALQNIGGIANVTLLPAASESDAPVIAFDTGPGVAVIDSVIEVLTSGAQRFDVDGARAGAAEPDQRLLSRLLTDPYLEAAPPKSTGREYFGADYALRLIEAARQLGIEDDDTLVATATALTADSIADAYRRFSPEDGQPVECFVSGGGARNPTLMAMLAQQLAPMPVQDLSALGWDPDAKEAAAFAILAHLFRMGKPGNVPSVTGASGPRILGKLSPA